MDDDFDYEDDYFEEEEELEDDELYGINGFLMTKRKKNLMIFMRMMTRMIINHLSFD